MEPSPESPPWQNPGKMTGKDPDKRGGPGALWSPRLRMGVNQTTQ